MAVTTDIVRTFRGPGAVIRDHLARPPREGVLLAYLFAGCALVFVAQWPRLSRSAHLTGEPFAELAAYELFAWFFVWPLFFYVAAALSYLVLHRFAPGLTGTGARLALFWAVLASAPLALFAGLMAGIAGPGLQSDAAGVLWLCGFAAMWILGLRGAMRP